MKQKVFQKPKSRFLYKQQDQLDSLTHTNPPPPQKKKNFIHNNLKMKKKVVDLEPEKEW